MSDEYVPAMNLIDFSVIDQVAVAFLLLFAIIFLRYVFVCLIFDVVFNRVWKDRFQFRRISTRLKLKPGQKRKEIYWSLLTSLIFSIFSLALIFSWQEGWTKIYSSFSVLDVIAIPLSVLCYLLVQDAYYYWLHRWMHRPLTYPYIHKIHHMSVVSTPWTSFSFHPLESLLQAITLPILVFVIPIHIVGLLLLLLIMTAAAVINHLEIEIYPRWLLEHRWGKYLIGATHHSKHHRRFFCNYGLYFSLWDHWLGTELEDAENMERH